MLDDSPEKESLASTAYWMAAVRAHESERVDRLFDDPWAALLAGQAWLDRIALIQARLELMSEDFRISMHWGSQGKHGDIPGSA